MLSCISLECVIFVCFIVKFILYIETCNLKMTSLYGGFLTCKVFMSLLSLLDTTKCFVMYCLAWTQIAGPSLEVWPVYLKEQGLFFGRALDKKNIRKIKILLFGQVLSWNKSLYFQLHYLFSFYSECGYCCFGEFQINDHQYDGMTHLHRIKIICYF